MRAHKIALATIIVVSAAGGLLCMATSGQTRAFRGPSLDQDLESQRAVLAQATVKSNVTEQDLNGTATEFENIAKFAIKQDGDRVENGLRAIVVAVDKLKGVVSGQTYRNLTDRLSDMREAQKNGDFEGVAFAAAEGYRATRLAQDPAALPAPIEVYMLDYTGLKAMALALTGTPDWQRLSAVGDETSVYWADISPKIKQKALRSLMDTIISGFKLGVAQQNQSELRNVAALQLDAVELLNGDFAKR